MHVSALLSFVCAAFLKLSAADKEPTCGPPPTVDRAEVSGAINREYPLGTVVTYSCDLGFVTDGNSIISECYLPKGSRSPTWTPPSSDCRPRSCGDPGYVENARRVGSLFNFPNRVYFECDDGYRLFGTSSRYCQASGTWSGRLPTCQIVSCNPPDDIQNGKAIYSSLEYGSELKYKCEKGFVPSNKELRYCSADGLWSGNAPECIEAQCDLPVSPHHGSVMLFCDQPKSGGRVDESELRKPCDQPRVDSKARYSCDEGKILEGSAVSTCLESGEWTFPPPFCLDPCSIPEIPNGRIGRYVPSRRDRNEGIYTELKVVTVAKEGESLFVRCNPGYNPLGYNEWQRKVTCRQGRWSATPRCEPASCRTNPPAVAHARVISRDLNHGGSVLYECEHGFVESRHGVLTCNLGTWKGNIPECKDVRCDTKKLQFPGLAQPTRNFFMEGEKFYPQCSTGYRVSRPEKSELTCERGDWKGHLPPCTVENCLDSPPVPFHGKVKTFSRLHTSTVKYECENGYILQGDSKVQCIFGKWKGELPVCVNSRCYLQDLKIKTGVSIKSSNVTKSGERLDVKCIEGYTANEEKPICMDGEWREGTGACKESNCIVRWIQYGAITKMELVNAGFNWRTFRWEKKAVFKSVPQGSTFAAGRELYASCRGRYTFQGTGENNVKVTCKKGRWEPHPVCLDTGTKYEESSSSNDKSSLETHMMEKGTHSVPAQRVAGSAHSDSGTTDINPYVLLKRTTQHPDENSEQDTCTCEITVEDEELIAYDKYTVLGYKSKVKNGSTVNFQCRNFGVLRLRGQKTLKCTDCRTWHSSDFPTCVHPEKGDALIVFDKGVQVSPEGILEVNKSTTVRLHCISNGIKEYPTWRFPQSPGTSVSNAKEEPNGEEHYTSLLDIQVADIRNSGNYSCSVGNYRPNVLILQVIDHFMKCPQFSQANNFLVYYDGDRQYRTKATFHCKAGKKLVGENDLICLQNGMWSGEPPDCIDMTCPELKESEFLRIDYSDDRKINSLGTFHCLNESHRSGVSFATCLPNGTWSHETPSCKLPSCPVGTLFDTIPEGVVPRIEDINNITLPYGTKLRLNCEDGLVLVGTSTATCGKEGIWEVGKVQCIQGCPAIEKANNSNMIVDPEKESYRFGEQITLSCPDGFVLTVEVQVMMCIQDGWSDRVIPDCKVL